MIEKLKPPTDSLYKFSSIIGVIIFLASVITPITFIRQLNAESAELIRDMRSLNLDAKTWEETWTQVQKDGARVLEKDDDFINSMKSDKPLQEKKRLLEEAKAAEKIYTENDARFRQQLTDWNKQGLQVDYKKDLLDSTQEYVQRVVTVCVVAAPIGLIISLTGFVLWYKRTQKYEDLVLRRKVEDEPTERRIIVQ